MHITLLTLGFSHNMFNSSRRDHVTEFIFCVKFRQEYKEDVDGTELRIKEDE